MPVYTKPEHSWSVDEMANATLLNQYHRDSMAATMHRIAYKTADETVTNSTTLQNDNHLFWSPPPSTTWYFRLVLWCSQPTVSSLPSDIKIAFSFQAGTIAMSSWYELPGGGATRGEWASTGFAVAMEAVDSSAAERTMHVIEGVHVFTSTQPNVWQVQWAQNTADLGVVTVYKGSTLWGVDVT